MPFRIVIRPSADAELATFPPRETAKLRDAMRALARGPIERRPGVDIRRLRGYMTSWRLKVGSYRAVFFVKGNDLVFTRFFQRTPSVYRP